MPRKKKNPDEEQEDKGKGVFQDAQSQTVSSKELETIMQQLLQQMGSQTQGSQQQKLSQTESSTPSGSSIQKPQTKAPSTKKTVASYAQAYAQKKLPDKTWGQVVETKTSKALVPIPQGIITKQEYDLLNQAPIMTQVSKSTSQIQKQMATASTSKAIVTQTQTQPNMDTPYFHKENQVKNIVQVEPEFFHQNPNQVALNFFPSGWHFRPTDFRKTREYYEFILVHSESIDINRHVDKKDKTSITHSTLQILKVLTPSQWGQDLFKPKLFGIEYDPPGYNYHDYVDAWSSIFWDQNELFKHTWFIYFKSRTKYQFPQWFVHWWAFFGPVLEIFPQKVVQAFELFKQKFNIGEDPFPIDLHYCSKLSLSWIFVWRYKFSKINAGSTLLPILQRVPSVRWWAKFDQSRIDSKAVDKWFKDNPQHLCMTEQSKFLNQKSRIQTILAATTDKTNLMNQLNSMLQILQQQDQASSSSQPVSSSASENLEEDEEEFIVDLSEP